MGYDAHKTEDLARDFNSAFCILEYVGFKELTIYHQIKPNFIKIKELRKK